MPHAPPRAQRVPAGGGGLIASISPQVPPPPPRLKVGRLHVRAVHVARATARARRGRRRTRRGRRAGGRRRVGRGDGLVEGPVSGYPLGGGDGAACTAIVPNPPARPTAAATTIFAIGPRNHPRLSMA